MKIKSYKFDNGKYEIRAAMNGSSLEAYRHGEFWQNMIGDNLTAAMLDTIDDLQEKIKQLEQRVSDYGWAATENARHDYQQNNEGWGWK